MFEARTDPVDKLWLGRVVAVPEFGGDGGLGVQKQTTAGEIGGVRFGVGDCAIGIRWYERLVDSPDGDRRDFEMTAVCVDVQSSTELRLVLGDIEMIGGEPLPRAPPRTAPAKSAELQKEQRRKWRLSAEDYALALGACWDETAGTPTVHRSDRGQGS